MREENAYALMGRFWNFDSMKRLSKELQANPCAMHHESLITENSVEQTKLQFKNKLIKRLFDDKTDKEKFEFPWKHYTEFRNKYIQTQMAIYVIFLSIMGKRGPSEVSTLRGIDISAPEPSTGKNATMRPSIKKQILD